MILTVELAKKLRSKEWRCMIQAARVVEVKASEFIAPTDHVYAMNCDLPAMGWVPDHYRGKVLVVCAPQYHRQVHEIVQQLRADQPGKE